MNGMSQKVISMTTREIDRLNLIRQCLDKKITKRLAAKTLDITEQHLSRLIKRYQQDGAIGIVSQKRGKSSNRSYSESFRELVISYIKKDFYDYGPTLAAEKLKEHYKLHICKETARQWMIEEGLWHPFQKPTPKLHLSRQRRACIGELLQIDGSHHDWFEGRGPFCTLLVFIDDATSMIMELFFCNDETTLHYFNVFKNYVLRYGVPRSIYNDKHGVFKVNHPEAKSGNGLTQFGRVLETLGVESIFATSPQAKGRVERANRILQDRLVKSLRFYNISDIQAANIFLEKFRQEYNQKFAKIPMDFNNLHRNLTEEEKNTLDKLFSIQNARTISKDLQVRHEGTIYNIVEPEQAHRLQQAQVLVCENINGQISIYHQDKALNYEVYRTKLHADQLLSRGEVNKYLDTINALEKSWTPPKIPHAANQY